MHSNILTAVTFFFLGAFVMELSLLGRPTEDELLQEIRERHSAELTMALRTAGS